jgi:hypothetical protein
MKRRALITLLGGRILTFADQGGYFVTPIEIAESDAAASGCNLAVDFIEKLGRNGESAGSAIVKDVAKLGSICAIIQRHDDGADPGSRVIEGKRVDLVSPKHADAIARLDAEALQQTVSDPVHAPFKLGKGEGEPGCNVMNGCALAEIDGIAREIFADQAPGDSFAENLVRSRYPRFMPRSSEIRSADRFIGDGVLHWPRPP